MRCPQLQSPFVLVLSNHWSFRRARPTLTICAREYFCAFSASSKATFRTYLSASPKGNFWHASEIRLPKSTDSISNTFRFFHLVTILYATCHCFPLSQASLKALIYS